MRKPKTPITDLVVQMLSTGLLVSTGRGKNSPVDAIRALEIETQGLVADALAVLNKRRKWDAERQRKKRAMSTGRAKPTTLPSLLVDSDSINRKEVRASGGRESGGRRGTAPTYLPDDWMPSDSHYAEAAAQGAPREVVDGAAAAMRNWTQAEAHRSVTKKSNWDATFVLTWLTPAIRDWKRDQRFAGKAKRKTFGDVFTGRDGGDGAKPFSH